MKSLRFPGDLLLFLYWVFFKPLTLDRYIHQIDPNLGSSPGLFVLWRRRKEHPEFRPLTSLALFHIFVTPWVFAFLLAWFFSLAGFDVIWIGVVVGVAISVAFSLAFSLVLSVVFSVVFGVLAGVGFGVIVGVAVGVGFGGAIGVRAGVALGVAAGVAFGVAFGVMTSVSLGVAAGVAAGMGFGTLFGVIAGVMFGVWDSVAVGVAVGVAIGVSSWIGYFRLANYIIEAPFAFLLSRSSRSDLRLSPVIWDELIWLPLPGLDRLLVSISNTDRQEGMKAIAYVAGSFRQGWAARRALLELTAYDVQTSRSLESIAAISETLYWLPPETRAAYKSLLLGLETVSRHAKAALESDTLYNRQEQLRLGLDATRSMRQGFVYDPNWRVGHVMSPALEVWEKVLAEEYATAQKQEAIPNVYVAGRPLDTKSKVFRGRRAVFKALEQELISPAEQRPAILLFGARRTGKTSVLRQLPETLGPQVISVAVDLQDAALEKDAAGLFYRISEKIRNDALQFRHLEFGELPRAILVENPYSAFVDWLKKLGETLGERWILLNLDEYEYIERMTNDGRLDERIFQLLRSLLQNHPRLTLLFSGAHTFEDLSPVWSHHLINARVVKVDPLSEDEAIELITNPIPDYPLAYAEDAVKEILSLTACQPYLIQAICRDLVNTKNEERSFYADQKSVTQAAESVLRSASPYFQDLWSGSDVDEVQRTIMGAIARSQSGRLNNPGIHAALLAAGFAEQTTKTGQAALRSLEHRDVLKSDESGWGFQIELVRRWIRRTQLGD
jgi:uncharacterized protein